MNRAPHFLALTRVLKVLVHLEPELHSIAAATATNQVEKRTDTTTDTTLIGAGGPGLGRAAPCGWLEETPVMPGRGLVPSAGINSFLYFSAGVGLLGAVPHDGTRLPLAGAAFRCQARLSLSFPAPQGPLHKSLHNGSRGMQTRRESPIVCRSHNPSILSTNIAVCSLLFMLLIEGIS